MRFVFLHIAFFFLYFSFFFFTFLPLAKNHSPPKTFRPCSERHSFRTRESMYFCRRSSTDLMSKWPHVVRKEVNTKGVHRLRTTWGHFDISEVDERLQKYIDSHRVRKECLSEQGSPTSNLSLE